mgnify:CR=1 FL=1
MVTAVAMFSPSVPSRALTAAGIPAVAVVSADASAPTASQEAPTRPSATVAAAFAEMAATTAATTKAAMATAPRRTRDAANSGTTPRRRAASAMAVLFLLQSPIETITSVALPILVITVVAPGLIGVDRARRLLTAWDDRIFRPGADDLDEQSQRERQSVAAQPRIATLTKRRRYLRGTILIAVLIFGGLELLARSTSPGYAQKSPWLMLGIGGVWFVILVVPAIVVEIRLHRPHRQITYR